MPTPEKAAEISAVMAEKSDAIMAQIGQELFRWLQGTGDMVADQAPLLAQEIVRYGLAKHTILAVFFAVPAVLLYKASVRALKRGENELDSDWGLAACAGFVVSCASAVVAIVNLVEVSKALFAPRLYILETIASLVKSAT